MSDIERTVRHIKNKDEMHKAVDNLKEGDQCLMLICMNKPEEPDVTSYKFFNYGEITVEHSYYLCGTYQAYMMSLMRDI